MKTKGNSILRKLLSVFLTVSLLFSFATIFTVQAEDVEIWDGTIAESFASGTGTEDDPYIIETASQLAYLANSNQSFSGKYIKLVNDIYLNDTTNWEDWETTAPANEWVPIGILSVDASNYLNFSGNFDGDKHTIYGIYTVGRKYAGLFAYSKGYIKNITVKESYISATTNSGGVIGRVHYNSVENCHNYATVVSTDSNSYSGGIVGYISSYEEVVTKSSNHGKIRSENYAGGICGYTWHTVTSLCYNTGDVSGGISGGIVGYQYTYRYNSNSSAEGKTLNCYNIGAISGTKSAGGICGELDEEYNNSNSPSILNVYNMSNVSSVGNGGQIVGQVVGQIAVKYAEPHYNVFGYYYNPTSTMQFGIGSATKDIYCVCLSKPKSLLQESYETFDFDTVWTMEGNPDYPYPMLIDNMPHVHDYKPNVEGNCTEETTITYTCTCGDSYTKTLEALGHDYVETIEKEGNCTEARVVKFTCSRCGDYYTEATPATGHKNETVTVNATCTEDGQTYEKCSNCGITMGDVTVIPATGHTYTSKATTKATCLTPGVMTYTCKCGDTYTEAIPATGHSLKQIVKDSTCTSIGQKYIVCENCGNIIGDIETIPLKEHNYKKVVTPATCTENGVTTYTCECGAYYEEVADALGHEEVIDKAVEATCTTDGKTEGKHCSVCNAVIVAQRTIPAFGHDYESVYTAPTCTEKGNTTYTCTTCGDISVEHIDALGHTEVIIEKIPATCTTDGQTESRSCSVCNAELVKSQVIPAFGHKEVIDKAVDASCTTLGKTEGSHCSVCGLVFNVQQTLPVLGHTEIIDKAIPATCTTNGKTEGVHCSTCNLVIVNQQTVYAFGHTETDWIIEKDPTDSEAGLKIKKCAVCDEVIETEEISPLGVMVYGIIKSSPTGKQTDNATLIELYENGNEEAVYSVTVDGSGELAYYIEYVKSGTYTVKVSKLNHVTREYEITVDSENVEQNFSINLIGDINGDGKIRMNDMNLINAHLKETQLLDGYALACADINGDGRVRMNDMNLVNAHLKETSLLW